MMELVSVKPGSMVYIDQWFGVAEEKFADVVFTVKGDAPRKGWKELVAEGFGHEDDYGSGSVFAGVEDLVEMTECDYCGEAFPMDQKDLRASEEDHCVCPRCVSFHDQQMVAWGEREKEDEDLEDLRFEDEDRYLDIGRSRDF
jgi:hypothetical protein